MISKETDKQTDDQLTPALRAMADATRLKILLMLEGRGRTVGEIVDFFEQSQPTISRHLQTLTAAGLVRRQRKGQNVMYELNPENLRDVCVSLANCFPCCCVSVSRPIEIQGIKKSQETAVPSLTDAKGRPTAKRHSGTKPKS
ncbi:MAG: metalloregulator ArsR/SmtB family transcription factor [candidate division Zixibacteria bacterium]|nr:metalloregulator ArsR/SmtB family transcription factor [candidate division Zixibacteria bacterium]